jgi:hypothetical protein
LSLYARTSLGSCATGTSLTDADGNGRRGATWHRSGTTACRSRLRARTGSPFPHWCTGCRTERHRD